MPHFLFLIIIISIITYYDYFYLKAVRQQKDLKLTRLKKLQVRPSFLQS